MTRKGFWLSCFYCVRENQSSMKRLNASVHQTTNCCHKITMLQTQRANNAFIPKLFTFKILFSNFVLMKNSVLVAQKRDGKVGNDEFLIRRLPTSSTICKFTLNAAKNHR